MAVGFTPKHIEELPLGNFTREQLLVLSIEASKKMNWELSYISNNGIIAYTNNGMFSWNAEIQIKLGNETATVKSASTGNDMIDFGKNKGNVKNFISAFDEVKSLFTSEELNLKYEELKQDIVADDQDVLNQPLETTTEKIQGFFSIFKPQTGFFFTPILLDLNILIFILMLIGGANIMLPDHESLLNWGANFRPITLEGQWWRLITSCFVHIGIIHLVMNMYALLYIGVLLEPLLGKTRFISAYLLAGLCASLTSLWWHDLTISAGASGAIFGMYGLFLALLTTNIIDKAARKPLLASIAVFVGYNLIFGMQGGIDSAAHIGGLVSGFVIGYLFVPGLKDPENKKIEYISIGSMSIAILIGATIIYNKIPNDIGKYDEKMKEFSLMESMAMEVYSLPNNTPKDKILYELKNRGIYYWKENIELIESLNELDLPDEIDGRNLLLKEYCEIRIKSYELLYKVISEDTDKYNAQIEDYNKQIEEKINVLGGGQ